MVLVDDDLKIVHLTNLGNMDVNNLDCTKYEPSKFYGIW